MNLKSKMDFKDREENPMTTNPKRGRAMLLQAVAVLALSFLAACSYSQTEAGETTCVFNGGPLDSKDFREYTEPGAGRESVGWMSDKVEVPLRLIQVDETDMVDGELLDAVNVGGMVMDFDPTISMRLNTKLDSDGDDKQKPRVCELIEVHLRPQDAYDFNDEDGRWRFTFLDGQIGPRIENSGNRVLQAQGEPVAMYFNTNGFRDEAADLFAADLQASLAEALGGEYFCGPGHRFGSDECGTITVILPQPTVSDEDEQILNAPRRAKTEANAQIGKANEAARQAKEVATAREAEATYAKQKADADEQIAQQEARTAAVDAEQEYLWCEQLVRLGQGPCWLVKAAENGNLPNVLGEIPEQTTVAIPAERDQP